MAKQTIEKLKGWFVTLAKPTQQQFWDWLDSFRHKDEKIKAEDLDQQLTTVIQNLPSGDAMSRLNSEVQVHIHDTNNPHLVTKEQLGLGNVDNTSDEGKPMSSATIEALNSKADLGEDGKVLGSQLPEMEDTNFANTDLVFTENRTHELGSNLITFNTSCIVDEETYDATYGGIEFKALDDMFTINSKLDVSSLSINSFDNGSNNFYSFINSGKLIVGHDGSTYRNYVSIESLPEMGLSIIDSSQNKNIQLTSSELSLVGDSEGAIICTLDSQSLQFRQSDDITAFFNPAQFSMSNGPEFFIMSMNGTVMSSDLMLNSWKTYLGISDGSTPRTLSQVLTAGDIGEVNQTITLNNDSCTDEYGVTTTNTLLKGSGFKTTEKYTSSDGSQVVERSISSFEKGKKWDNDVDDFVESDQDDLLFKVKKNISYIEDNLKTNFNAELTLYPETQSITVTDYIGEDKSNGFVESRMNTYISNNGGSSINISRELKDADQNTPSSRSVAIGLDYNDNGGGEADNNPYLSLYAASNNYSSERYFDIRINTNRLPVVSSDPVTLTAWKKYLGNPYTIYSYTDSEVGKWVDGKAIYMRIINTGALTNATAKTVAHGIAGIDKIIHVEGGASDGNNFLQLPFSAPAGYVILAADKTNITITPGSDRRTFTTSNVIIKYTKI